MVLRVRRSLERRAVGLMGPLAVQQEIRQHRLLPEVPSLTTIYTWLKEAKLIASPPPVPPRVYYLEPGWGAECPLHLMDWTARYLIGGEKVFVFHTVDAETHALGQTICANKALESAWAHVLQVWQQLGCQINCNWIMTRPSTVARRRHGASDSLSACACTSGLN